MTEGLAAHRLPDAVAVFAAELRSLLTFLDPATGWYGVFAQRDPAGLRACLDGRDVPPWDVVDALLHDLAARPGDAEPARLAARLRARYTDAVAAHDRGGGARAVLADRLEAMEATREKARRRVGDLTAAFAAAQSAGHTARAERFAADLAWTRDDLDRAAARCTELRARLDALPAPPPVREPAPAPPPVRDDPGTARPVRRPARPRPRGARFAGLEDVAVRAPAPAAPRTGPPPRGARFAGALGAEEAPPPAPRTPPPVPEELRAAVGQTAARLARLRAEGQGGPAHALLCACAAGPAERLPLLADALERTGLAPDVGVLLWEAARLAPEPLAAAAGALADAGRHHDCARLLRQGVARPVEEVAATALALVRDGRRQEATTVLAALVRARSPQEAAAVAAAGPRDLPPLLAAAAGTVSAQHRRDVEAALARAS
ncbi:hypothetical protein V1J52_01685 [Streptomyces sp. TRM 70351]|uniref:hypothetical protein n=1 Tax=Streptomyces sp. TRM 70351 TaxID=3116552 RepID=UPI002E7B457E|nr:hypothetical protein [Streptomyces sp. TRM 70351]MEE1926906.1 hypothetical protein [Streptomyces sp. TRM 70351]